MYLGANSDSDDPYVNTTRIVEDNLTYDQALMINGNIGTEGWREASHLVIQRNKASHNSIMVNTSIPVDRFKDLLAARNETVRQMSKQNIERRNKRVSKTKVEKTRGMFLLESVRADR